MERTELVADLTQRHVWCHAVVLVVVPHVDVNLRANHEEGHAVLSQLGSELDLGAREAPCGDDEHRVEVAKAHRLYVGLRGEALRSGARQVPEADAAIAREGIAGGGLRCLLDADLSPVPRLSLQAPQAVDEQGLAYTRVAHNGNVQGALNVAQPFRLGIALPRIPARVLHVGLQTLLAPREICLATRQLLPERSEVAALRAQLLLQLTQRLRQAPQLLLLRFTPPHVQGP
mmetsp:Transcript_1774/g.5597  ORF Transcript_1774/g.5597 Transcript_1774/m.5597 type:complete len:231 (+) Transcript_1774:857-1549(+)